MTTDRRDPSEALTSTEAARRLGVSPRTVKRLPASQLPYFRLNARGDRRYPRAELERFIRERTLEL